MSTFIKLSNHLISNRSETRTAHTAGRWVQFYGETLTFVSLRLLMKLISLSVLFIAFWGCTRQEEADSFISIDYSSYKGFFESLRIMDDGEVVLCKDYSPFNNPQEIRYYRYSLDYGQMDSILSMIEPLTRIQLDSLYFTQCDNCISFSLIISWNDKKLSTSYNGEMYYLKELNNIYNLFEFLEGFSNRDGMLVDTTVNFDSKEMLILPPPPDYEKYL